MIYHFFIVNLIFKKDQERIVETLKYSSGLRFQYLEDGTAYFDPRLNDYKDIYITIRGRVTNNETENGYLIIFKSCELFVNN